MRLIISVDTDKPEEASVKADGKVLAGVGVLNLTISGACLFGSVVQKAVRGKTGTTQQITTFSNHGNGTTEVKIR